MKTKNTLTISIKNELFDMIGEKFNNKSKYIEWLIYKDLLKNTGDGELKSIIL